MVCDVGEVPPELVVIRYSQKFNKLPSEILAEDWGWMELLAYVERVDSKIEADKERIQKLKNNNRQSNGR